MKLTVMMAAYNTAKFVADAIESLVRQRNAGLDVEVIVVNDGSTDGTTEILRQVAARDEGVRLIETPNQGVTRARNVALRELGDCDFVSFLDSDDLSPSGHFARTMDMFHAQPDLDLVYCSCRLFEVTGSDRFAPSKEGRMADVRGVHLGSGIYRKTLSDRVGQFDESFDRAEDIDFMLRMFELAPRYAASDHIGLYYRRHGGNMTLDTAALRRSVARALFLSVRRRRSNNGASLPDGIFDATNSAEIAGW